MDESGSSLLSSETAQGVLTKDSMCPSLPAKYRFWGFIICFLLGILFSLLATIVFMIGGGAVKFALSVKSEDGKEQMTALLVMVSGFMIRAAVKEMNLFTIPGSEFLALITFISKWIRHVGAVGTFVGAVMFAFSIKDNNAVNKVTALKTLTAGAMVVSIAALLPSFV